MCPPAGQEASLRRSTTCPGSDPRFTSKHGHASDAPSLYGPSPRRTPRIGPIRRALGVGGDWILNAIYEADFAGFSYGFRPVAASATR